MRVQRNAGGAIRVNGKELIDPGPDSLGLDSVFLRIMSAHVRRDQSISHQSHRVGLLLCHATHAGRHLLGSHLESAG